MSRFRIDWWRAGERSELGHYTVSIPNYEGGEVVTADEHDALVAAVESFLESMAYAAPEMWPLHVNAFAQSVNAMKEGAR